MGRFSILWTFAAALALITAGCSSNQPPEPVPAPDPAASAARAANLIGAGDVRAHVAFLASDELAGRDTPSPGLEAAAEYIARRFEALGLQPAGDAGGWVQRYPYVSMGFDAARSEFSATGSRGGASLAFGEQWFAMPVTAEQAVVAGPVVYAGPASGAEFNEEARDRIVAVTAGESLGMEMFGLIQTATAAGASGLVLILHPSLPAAAIPQIVGQVGGLPPQAIPVVGVLRSGAEELFSVEGLDIDIVAPAEPPSDFEAGIVDLGLDLTIRTTIERTEVQPPNVVAVLEGSDPELRDTYVVYSAHFDHVGIGTPDADGDSIYNGADDDASGTALVLEVARAFSTLPEPPRRSVVFLAVSGEEKGLLGARHWATHPTVPIESVVANVNADMVGRNAPDTLIAIGGEYSSLGDLSASVAASHPDIGLVVAPDPDPSENAFFRSDHVAFVREGIPSVFYTTWLHDDYHAPSDEVENIDADKLARVARLAFWVGWEIAQDARPPSWNPGAWAEVSKILEESPF
jgi:hypothetical protein